MNRLKTSSPSIFSSSPGWEQSMNETAHDLCPLCAWPVYMTKVCNQLNNSTSRWKISRLTGCTWKWQGQSLDLWSMLKLSFEFHGSATSFERRPMRWKFLETHLSMPWKYPGKVMQFVITSCRSLVQPRSTSANYQWLRRLIWYNGMSKKTLYKGHMLGKVDCTYPYA